MGNRPFNPKSTTFTNLMLDYIMPDLSPNAWKIICLAMRKTEGWEDKSTYSGRKESDIISVSQFMKGCGIGSDHTVKLAIKECVDKNYLIQSASRNTFRYQLNIDYELPDGAETAPIIGAETAIEIGAETAHTNNKVNNNINIQNSQNKLQENPAKETVMRSSEEIKKATEDALFRSMASSQIGYAQYPERIRPVVERMEKLWHFKPPQPSKKKNGQYAFWLESCDEVLVSCGEFGVELLDKLHEDWRIYMESHGGCGPHTVSSPKSLVSAVLAKAALLRSNSTAHLWQTNNKNSSSSRLDV